MCGVYGACINTIVACHGTCNITCDFEDNGVCPELEDISLSPTEIPTPFPTPDGNVTDWHVIEPTPSPILCTNFPTNVPTPPTLNPITAPTSVASIMPSMVPTANNESESESESESEAIGLKTLSEVNNYAILGFALLFGIIILIGFIDAKAVRRNELFVAQGVLFCAAYTGDFVSGLSINLFDFCVCILFVLMFLNCIEEVFFFGLGPEKRINVILLNVKC